MIIAVEKSEAFQVGRRPGMLALKELVHFALRSGAVIDSSGVGVFSFPNMCAGCAKAVFYTPKSN